MRALPYKAQTSIAGSVGGMFRPKVFHAELPGGVDFRYVLGRRAPLPTGFGHAEPTGASQWLEQS
jgi:hypothetical protein